MSNLGVALGGGGARGLAHVGVLKVLDLEGIKIDEIAGCSMGAVVGGLYAYFGNAEEVEVFVLDVLSSEKYKNLGIDKLSKKKRGGEDNYLEQFFDFIGASIQLIKALKHDSYFDDKLVDEIFSFIPDVPIENLKIKFSAVATDLFSGEEVILSNGSLLQAVKASSAIPGIFPPVQINNHLFVDGSISDLVPVRVLEKNGVKKILAVNVIKKIVNPNPPKNILEVLYRSTSISTFSLTRELIKNADLIIEPYVGEYDWADFDYAKEIILAGENAALIHLDEIKKLYKKNNWLNILRKWIEGKK